MQHEGTIDKYRSKSENRKLKAKKRKKWNLRI